MNYFELYNIPVSFLPDPKEVSRTYFALQRKYHPDFFAHATPAEREEALEQSAQANKAYKTFQNQDATMRYVLQLKGVLEDEEKYQLPPDFLMEVLELNEMKMDGADENTIQQRALALQEEIYTVVKPLIDNYEDGKTSEAHLLQVKDYYYKNRYLQRLLEGELKH
jgi:molecular chaperone HscB